MPLLFIFYLFFIATVRIIFIFIRIRELNCSWRRRRATLNVQFKRLPHTRVVYKRRTYLLSIQSNNKTNKQTKQTSIDALARSLSVFATHRENWNHGLLLELASQPAGSNECIVFTFVFVVAFGK